MLGLQLPAPPCKLFAHEIAKRVYTLTCHLHSQDIFYGGQAYGPFIMKLFLTGPYHKAQVDRHINHG